MAKHTSATRDNPEDVTPTVRAAIYCNHGYCGSLETFAPAVAYHWVRTFVWHVVTQIVIRNWWLTVRRLLANVKKRHPTSTRFCTSNQLCPTNHHVASKKLQQTPYTVSVVLHCCVNHNCPKVLLNADTWLLSSMAVAKSWKEQLSCNYLSAMWSRCSRTSLSTYQRTPA